MLLHHRQRGLHAGNGPEKIGVECLPHCCHIHIGDGVQQAVPGIVDPHIDSLIVMQSQADDAVDFFAVADVTGQRQGTVGMTDTSASSFGPSGVAREQHHARFCSAKILAMASPMPIEAPVTTTTFPARFSLPEFISTFFSRGAATVTGVQSENHRRGGRKKLWSFYLSLLPLFPLDLVLFPGASLPLHIFEPRYREMISECLDRKQSFGVVRAKEEGVAEIGCTAEIITVAKKYPDGRMDIVTEGRERFEVMQVSQERSFLQAEVLYLRDEPGQASPEEIAQAVKLQGEILRLAGSDPLTPFATRQAAHCPSAWSDRFPSIWISSRRC